MDVLQAFDGSRFKGLPLAEFRGEFSMEQQAQIEDVLFKEAGQPSVVDGSWKGWTFVAEPEGYSAHLTGVGCQFQPQPFSDLIVALRDYYNATIEFASLSVKRRAAAQ